MTPSRIASWFPSAPAAIGAMLPLLTSIGAMLSAHPAASVSPCPTINLKSDCGAKGDGKNNDTAAFQRAARLIQKYGGGTLIIPKSVYVVGKQDHAEGEAPYYRVQSIFRVDRVNSLRIEGNGATVRFARGLHYGAFDPKNGQPYEKMPDYDMKKCRITTHNMPSVSGSCSISLTADV